MVLRRNEEARVMTHDYESWTVIWRETWWLINGPFVALLMHHVSISCCFDNRHGITLNIGDERGAVCVVARTREGKEQCETSS
jgi:hypothetical protein